MNKRIVFHVDVNSAFLSWEAVRRLKEGDTLDLRTVPSAVGGDAETRHGIITARSIPAKAYGIQTAEPVAQALRKCPQLILVPGDFALYSRCSKAFIAICREYTDLVEQFSIDECSMDVTDYVKGDEEDAVKLAYEIKDRIKDELGFTVNIGVSENKLLAKMASDFQKPDRVHTLWPREIEKKMWPLPVNDLLFVGRASKNKLNLLGIRTIGELAKMPEDILIAHFGEKGGHSLHQASNGISESLVLAETEAAKGYGNSTTLPYDLTEVEEVYPVLLSLSESVCARMRKDHVKGTIVTCSYKGNDFISYSKQHKIEPSTDASNTVYKEARMLFDKLWDQTTPIRLLGVSVSGMTDGSFEQMSLFGTEERKKNEKLDAMMDEIRKKYGKDSIKRTVELESPEHKKKPRS